jgi:hypothetical protein
MRKILKYTKYAKALLWIEKISEKTPKETSKRQEKRLNKLITQVEEYDEHVYPMGDN